VRNRRSGASASSLAHKLGLSRWCSDLIRLQPAKSAGGLSNLQTHTGLYMQLAVTLSISQWQAICYNS